MVLQQTHPLHGRAQHTRPDPNRILGISSTLALNVLALTFLLMPMTLPPAPSALERRPTIEVIDIVPLPPTTPPPPQVPVTRAQPRPAPRTLLPPPVAAATDLPATPATPTPDASFDADPQPLEATPLLAPAGPAVGMQLQYRSAPPPDYPRQALQRRQQGTVLLRVLVDIDGRPIEVVVERSSGHALLDREAQRQVLRQWRFQPALRDGQPVQAVGLVPIDFSLSQQ